jgi:hypothetical protein
MSMTEEEARAEEWLAELYEEHKREALAEFRAERLQDYYLRFPDVAKPAFAALHEARMLEAASSTAAAIMASVASEVTVKTVLLKPIVHGHVHSEPLAGLVTDVALQQHAVARYKDLLFALLREYGGLDLQTYARPGVGCTLWKEIQDNQVSRNAAVHSATTLDAKDAQRAIAVAGAILETVFPQVIAKLNLHLHNGYSICNKVHLGEPWESMLAARGLKS